MIISTRYRSGTYLVLTWPGTWLWVQVSWGIDLATEHERWLAEEHYKQPVIVYNYPKEIKAFYMKLNEDGKTVAAMDVLVPKVGGQTASVRVQAWAGGCLGLGRRFLWRPRQDKAEAVLDGVEQMLQQHVKSGRAC